MNLILKALSNIMLFGRMRWDGREKEREFSKRKVVKVRPHANPRTLATYGRELYVKVCVLLIQKELKRREPGQRKQNGARRYVSRREERCEIMILMSKGR